jgi:uncharacterized protein (DUF362 family)
MKTSQVALVRCADYDQERVNHAVRQSVDLIGGMGQYVKSGNQVLLKVNLLSAGEGVHTHPNVARAVPSWPIHQALFTGATRLSPP